MDVLVNGKRIRLDPTQSIGKGGEADIFAIGGGTALKLFKPPTHPDLVGQAAEQRAARERLQTHQRKLPELVRLATVLPPSVITPQALATKTSTPEIVGYTMRFLDKSEVLLRYADKTFRSGGISHETVVAIFRDLCRTVEGVHRVGVIGDFNDLNVLVKGTEAYLIDADSFQFGPYFCRVFTERFVDPLVCDPAGSSLVLAKPYTPASDWYAFSVMLMQSLLFVNPYDGIYRPKDPAKRIPHETRPLQRITVFHEHVQYPKPAIHYRVLPDELLDYWFRLFVKDERGPFPAALLQSLRWTTCPQCGTEHARMHCPQCALTAPAAVREVTRIRGTETATRIFRSRGTILAAATHQGTLSWLYHEAGAFKREDGSVVMTGDLDPFVRYRIGSTSTYVGRANQVITIAKDGTVSQTPVDSFGQLPVFDANAKRKYWTHNGQLLRDGLLGQEYIGDVLAGQTLFWTGPAFGFGFYRAGTLSVAFVFDAEHRGINDSVKLPPMRGQLVDAACSFTDQRCWFLVSLQDGGKIINRCVLIRHDGTVEAVAESEAGNGTWLGTIRSTCAAGNFLLAATDDGIVRVESDHGRLAVTQEFPDTEPFVDSDCRLFPGRDGLYVVDRHEVRVLKIAPKP